MIVTVTTLKDRLTNVQRFVRGNLAGGVDHLIVFLDAPDDEVLAWLTDQREVTVVVTDDSWWHDQRPQLLNKRQRVNANLARAVLRRLDWAEWLFHIDADEIVRIDREALTQVPRRRPAVGLRPLEVVSQMHPVGEPRLFKPLLGDDDLALLLALGALPEASNSLYFRSHIAGKVGVRPQADVWLGIHKATDNEDNRLPLVRRPGFEMLHLESYSGEEFVRKWTAMVGSGPRMHFGTHRMQLATALKAVVDKDLPPEQRSRFFELIYERHMADPVDLLRDLGLLREVDPLQGGHTPQPLPEGERSRLVGFLEELRDQDKWQFLPDSDRRADAEKAKAKDPSRETGPAEDPPRRRLGRLRRS
ncbi:glycosyltransferase family 2 protein [Nocardioides sp. W7]|uniref:glycosyltransferase family 2 protein n=1 Tax=Nocardioides sp. W7 TaxID=2931390 RepID=UPI001FD5FA36|nr:glycosyltransferase family 2 protein [Nocardioides sp. W7]